MFLAFRYLINKMLKKHGVDFDFVMDTPTIEDKPWREYFTWTTEDQRVFATEATEYIRQTLHYSRKQSRNVVINFLSNQGLSLTTIN